MAKNPRQQEKLLRLQQIFLQETDEEHPLSMQELIARLAAFGISAERKSIYENIATLNECGMEILQERHGNKTCYYAADPVFEAAELRLLADAVASSRFITAKKSAGLIKKLSALTSRHQGAGLRRQVYVPSRIKSMNETVFYLVDELHRAIEKNRAITFTYYEWQLEAGEVVRLPRHDGKRYLCSPWQLLWQDEFYYLIAFDHETRTIRHYRVDRMGGIRRQAAPREGQEAFSAIRMEDYTARLFGMFGGQTARVTLAFPPRLLGVMIDRFGKELHPRSAEDGRLTVRAEVIPSLPFYGWLLSLGPEVQLLEPQEICKEYKALLKRSMENG